MIPIVVDLDGVLAEYNLSAHAILSSQCSMSPLPSDGPKEWDWYASHGATPAAIATLHDCMKTESFWSRLFSHADMTPRAVADLRRLCDEHEVSFVTARPMGQKTTIEWLYRHFALENAQVVIVPGVKAMALAAMQPAVLIEDTARNILDFIAAEEDYKLPECLKILVSRPYNQKYHQSLAERGVRIVASTGAALSLALTMSSLRSNQKKAKVA